MEVYITGLGVISSVGTGVEANWDMLSRGITGITESSAYGLDEGFPVGEVKLSNQELREKYGLKLSPVSRTTQLGWAAAQEAWGAHQIHPNIRTGLIAATSVGGMDQSERFYRQWLKGDASEMALLSCHDSGSSAEVIARLLGIEGYVTTLSTACSSGANAILLGARMIRNGRLDRVVVGGMDALCRFTLQGFNSLMIYDKEWCRPFDDSRVGLNLGEGAGFLVLENEKSRRLTGSVSYGQFGGGANAADAYHQTASSPDGKGATLAIHAALKMAQLHPDEIAYVNAHGTGTKNNDLSESVALKNVFGTKLPPFSSTKAYTGHTLAAAGAIEAVYAMLCINNGVILPNLNFKQPMEETGLVPVCDVQPALVKTVLSNSFGFGGNNTALIFRR